MSDLAIEFCGEWFRPVPGGTFDIGRDGDLEIEDNPYLHRHFLRISHENGIWWLANVGSLISATVCDAGGGVQSWLSPGNRLPLVFPSMAVVFTAGPTTYEMRVRLQGAPYQEIRSEEPSDGATTIGAIPFTISQKQLILSLAEPVLRRDGTGLSEIPTSADAARRLGWATTRFNRKLDNVCERLDRIGVKGLRGGVGALATNRRARLVEYAVASRLVTTEDLPLLDLVDESS
ncbi:hypothetical protein EQW78_12590 [Oerskovia turbata]|uniref:FHA domain-containing protein n=1 Tax=Oerskovia turbata TaxID=1713 RepID=A0A4Q1KS92_9CELL|nr:hypothetical protein [Oerskovia turbata]RXR23562.1 hypothetical protein EQW73_14610 [Oerskovia turbata]RXR32832.1 hypothetical protein EQW78_12590 [Oerskovia turbata]TGJ95131.1 hypothetical protein DLJ96_16035 [Actinotalea fermentans ATCC 43279 = JCM 9966 = DSM 3133]